MKNGFYLIVAGFVFVAALSGCSVQGGKVSSKPPVIEPRAISYGVKFGEMAPQIASVRLWPTGWTEAEAEEKVNIINKCSVLVVKYSAEMAQKKDLIDTMFADFNEHHCIRNYATPNPTEGSPEPQPQPHCEEGVCSEDEVIPWREIAPTEADYDRKVAELGSCKKNQDDRGALRRRIQFLAYDGERHVDLKDNSINVLNGIMDETFGSGADKIKINPDTTAITIMDPTKNPESAPVMVKIGGFNGKGGVQTSNPDRIDDPKRIKDVSIDKNGRRLKFTVPDLKSPYDSQTQRYAVEYRFDLSRVENLFQTDQKSKPDGSVDPRKDFAAFKGDVFQVTNGTITRKGSGLIFGYFAAFPGDVQTSSAQ